MTTDMTPHKFEVICVDLLKHAYPEPEFRIEFRKLINTPTRRFIPDIVIRRNTGEVYVIDCKYYQPGMRKVDKNTVDDLEDYRRRMNATRAFILASQGADITERAIIYSQTLPVTIIRVMDNDTNIQLGV